MSLLQFLTFLLLFCIEICLSSVELHNKPFSHKFLTHLLFASPSNHTPIVFVNSSSCLSRIEFRIDKQQYICNVDKKSALKITSCFCQITQMSHYHSFLFFSDGRVELNAFEIFNQYISVSLVHSSGNFDSINRKGGVVINHSSFRNVLIESNTGSLLCNGVAENEIVDNCRFSNVTCTGDRIHRTSYALLSIIRGSEVNHGNEGIYGEIVHGLVDKEYEHAFLCVNTTFHSCQHQSNNDVPVAHHSRLM